MDLLKKKELLVKKFRESNTAKNEAIIQAFLKVPREEFVLKNYIQNTYDDHALPIMASQTISAPHMCIYILSFGRFELGIQKVLEIGAGSGYQAALMAELLGKNAHIYSIERLDLLAEFAQKNLERTGYGDRVTVICADGTRGYPDLEIPPFDRIIITAAGPQVPPPLIDQLIINGYLYMPLGHPGLFQEWIEAKKIADHKFIKKSLLSVGFVPLVGEYGVSEY
ncbi:MAG: Protein-L-isoaspartate O-methyltransferase [Candidatus Heimdallarchaeota archaeon LC_3]|nr:MAG: Protein-L-isoaspartate O-methyltransferase [Candidatus Heimdallarchaeota archaeon LC_3]